MGRPWQYSRSRRTLMQAVMWVILGATVGLAALVTQSRSAVRPVEFGPAVYTVGDLQLHVPMGWVRKGRTGRRLILGEPTDGGSNSRMLIIEEDRLPPGATALDYLKIKMGAQPMPRPRPARLCGQPALLVATQVLVNADDDSAEPNWATLTCTVLPSGLGVAVQLRTAEEPSERDFALLQQMCNEIVPSPDAPRHVAPAPTPAPTDDGDPSDSN